MARTLYRLDPTYSLGRLPSHELLPQCAIGVISALSKAPSITVTYVGEGHNVYAKTRLRVGNNRRSHRSNLHGNPAPKTENLCVPERSVRMSSAPKLLRSSYLASTRWRSLPLAPESKSQSSCLHRTNIEPPQGAVQRLKVVVL